MKKYSGICNKKIRRIMLVFFMLIGLTQTGLNDIQANTVVNINYDVIVKKLPDSGSLRDMIDEQMKDHPSRYRLYNENKSIQFEGVAYGVSDNNVYVRWSAVTDSSSYLYDYLGLHNSAIHNLPYGNYTIEEYDPGGEPGYLAMQNKSAMPAYLNSSFNNNKHMFTFTVSEETLNTLMQSHQSTKMSYSFYTGEARYYISYDGNGGNGTMNQMAAKMNTKLTLAANKFQRKGYLFTGWNTVAQPDENNPGTAYADSEVVNINSNLKLYAQWTRLSSLTVRYHYAQGEAGDVTLLPQDYIQNNMRNGTTYEVKTPFISGYTAVPTVVKGEMQDEDVVMDVYYYKDSNGNEVPDVNETYTVTFVDHDGTMLYQEQVLEGEDATPPADPVRDGYTFNGWNGTYTNVRQDETVRAEYTENSVPVEPSTPEEPNIPSQPDVPQEPSVPEEPVVPEVPAVPEVPVVPIEPADPTLPVTPVVPLTPVPVTTPPVTTPAAVVNPITVTPAPQPVVNTEPVQQDNQKDKNETENVKDQETPKAKGTTTSSWALFNLLCAAITVVLAVFILVSKRRREEDEDKNNMAYKNEEDKKEEKRGLAMRGVSVILALLAVVIFILTEDITQPMILFDAWSLLMLVITVVQVVTVMIARRWKQSENEDSKTTAA